MSSHRVSTADSKLIEWMESQWERHHSIISITFGVAIGILHYNGIIRGVRESTGNIVTIASMLTAITGVFLSLLVSLKESPIFDHIRKRAPAIGDRLFIWTRNELINSIIVAMIAIAISVTPRLPTRSISSIGVGIFAAFFCLMSIGSFFTIKLIADLVLKSWDKPQQNVIKN